MTRTSIETAHRRTAWRARAAVLGPLAIAALATAAALGSNAGMAYIAPLWLAAIVWAVLASLAGALLRGFRHGDWSAFGRFELPDGRDDRIDWISRTGAYAWMRIEEDRRRHDGGHLR